MQTQPVEGKNNMQTQGFSVSQFFKSRTGLALLGFLAIAAFYLLTEHTAHVLGSLPYALLLLCVVLHLFMHRGHGSHAGHEASHNGVERNGTDGARRPHTGERKNER